MKRVLVFFAMSLTLPGAAFGVSAPAKSPAKPAVAGSKPLSSAPAVPPGAIPIRRVTMSPEGIAKVTQMTQTPDPRIQQLVSTEQGLVREKARFLTGDPIDMAKLETLLRREEAVMGELRVRQNDQLLTVMRALSDNDRIALLQNAAIKSGRPQTSPASVPATPAAAVGR